MTDDSRRSGGLTLPSNPAQELQRIIAEEGRGNSTSNAGSGSSEPPPSPSPPNEETFITSKEGSHEGRKEGANVRTSARANDVSNEGRGTRRKEGAGTRANPPSKERASEGAGVGAGTRFLEDVLGRVKEGRQDGGKEVLTRLNVDIPDDLHLRLKMHCLKNGIKLRQLVPALLEAYLEEAGE